MDEFQLTRRQREVVIEMCKGRSNKEIARALGMAEATVKLHLTEIFRSMGVRNRTTAIIKASNFAVTDPEPAPPLTDVEIFREFVKTSFTTINEEWPDKVLKLSRAIEAKIKGKNCG